jgi:hypothetical protein
LLAWFSGKAASIDLADEFGSACEPMRTASRNSKEDAADTMDVEIGIAIERTPVSAVASAVFVESGLPKKYGSFLQRPLSPEHFIQDRQKKERDSDVCVTHHPNSNPKSGYLD